MTDTATTPVIHVHPGSERDDDAGGPAHPAPGHLPPEPEPETGPERHDDEPGGPSHPAPGHRPPASPETGSDRW